MDLSNTTMSLHNINFAIPEEFKGVSPLQNTEFVSNFHTESPVQFTEYEDLGSMNHSIKDGIIYYDGSTKKQNQIFEEITDHHKRIADQENFRFFSMPKPTTLTLLSKLSDIVIRRDETESMMNKITQNAILLSKIFPMVRTIMTNKKKIELLPSTSKKKRKKRIFYKVNYTKRKEKDGELFSTQISLKLCHPNEETRKRDLIINVLRDLSDEINIKRENNLCDLIHSFIVDPEDDPSPKQKYYFIKLFYNGTIHIPGVLNEDFSDVDDIIKCFCVFLRFITGQKKIQLAYFKPCMRNYISNNIMLNQKCTIQKRKSERVESPSPKRGKTEKLPGNRIKTNKFLNTLKFKKFLLSKVTCSCKFNRKTKDHTCAEKQTIISQYNEMRRNVHLYSCHLKLEDTNEMVLKFNNNITNEKDKFSIVKISNKKITFNGLTSEKEIYMIYYWLQNLIREFLENKTRIEEDLRKRLDHVKSLISETSKTNLYHYFKKNSKNKTKSHNPSQNRRKLNPMDIAKKTSTRTSETNLVFYDFEDVAKYLDFQDVDHLTNFMIDNDYQDLISWPNLLYI